MSRLQLAIDVADLDEAVAFYSQMFSAEPTKVRPGYANFAIDEPPLSWYLTRTPTVVAQSTIWESKSTMYGQCMKRKHE